MGGRTNGDSGGQDEEGDIPVTPGQQGGSNEHGPTADDDRLGGGAPADGNDDD